MRPDHPPALLDRLTIASAQYPIGAPRSFDDWAENVSQWVADGAATGADLLVFPEYGAIELAATCGAAVSGDLRATLAAVADLAEPMQTTFAVLAHRHRIHILAPSGPARPSTGHGGFVNSARLITPAGRVGTQDKLIMTPFEQSWGVQPGTALRVFDTVLGRIGVAICYDSEFPLLVRAQAEAGADLILIPSCTERVAGWSRVRTAALARALESQIATVTSPTVGTALWSPVVDHNTGAAGIFTPADATIAETGVLAEGGLNESGWVSATIDLAALRQLRDSGEMRNRSDWSRQPGAQSLTLQCDVVDLKTV